MNTYHITEFEEKYGEAVKGFLLSILEGEFGHYHVQRPDLENISEYYQKDKGNFWVVYKDATVIGTAGLTDYGEGIGYVQRMSVDKQYRGTGLAQKLLATVIEFAKANNFISIYLATSPNLIAANKFYPKEGFRKIDKLPKQIPTPIAPIYFVKEM